MKRLLCLLSLACLASPAWAIDWSNGGGDNAWSNGANWVGGVEPTSADSVRVGLTGPNRAVVTQAGEAAANLDVGYASNAGELVISSGSLQANQLGIGGGAFGTSRPGSVTVEGSGQLILGGGILAGLNGNASVGNESTFTLKDNGVLQLDGFTLGQADGSRAIITLESGTVNANPGGPIRVGMGVNTYSQFNVKVPIHGGYVDIGTGPNGQVGEINLSGAGKITLSGSGFWVGQATPSLTDSNTLTIATTGTAIVSNGLFVRQNGAAVQSSGDVLLTGNYDPNPNDWWKGGFWSLPGDPGNANDPTGGLYDLQGGTISVPGNDPIMAPAVAQMIAAGSLFTTAPGMMLVVNYDAGLNRTVLSLAAIPEPATVGLVSIAMLGLAMARRRSK